MQQSADFWNDQKKARTVIQEFNMDKELISKYEQSLSELEDMDESLNELNKNYDQELFDLLNDEYEEVNSHFEEFEMSVLLSNDYDHANAILEIHPGAGGTESQDWASMLYRMYQRYAAKNGYSFEVVDYQDGDEAGIKSCSVVIKGDKAYGYLKGESGVHRLVRISPFDAGARRHTSFASVEVTPEFNDEIDITIDEKDLEIDTMRSSGAGGQHINKTESAVRITHIPTGVVVSCQTERSQIQNRETAMKMLKSKLFAIKEREHLDKIEAIKGDMKEIAWGSQIRSYVFHPYSMVKDHRTDYEVGNVQAVMDGEIDGFINAYLNSKVK